MISRITVVTISEQLLPDARKWLRRSSTALDDDIQQTIEACLMDMSNAGIAKIDDEDSLIKQAVKSYLRGNFGYDDHPERWLAAYEHLKASLALSSDYTGTAEVSNE